MTTDRLRAFCEASIEAAETVGAWYDVELCPVRGWTLFGYAALRGSAACISATSLPDEETALVVASTHNWLLADGAAGGHAVRPPLTYVSTAYQAALRDCVDKGALTRTVRESTVVIDDVEYAAGELTPELAAHLREVMRRRAERRHARSLLRSQPEAPSTHPVEHNR